MEKQKDIFRRLKAYSHGFHSNATEEENKVYDAKIEQLKARILTLCDELLKKYDKMETFDEEVFNQMVEQIVVMGKNRLLYKFKNGYTADIEVIDYYLERDEIGEVQIYASTKC